MRTNHYSLRLRPNPIRRTGLLMCVLMVVLALPGWAALITVDPTGDYQTIQDAIDHATTDVDEIVVSPGRYVENVDFGSKNLIVRSTDASDPVVVTTTIIDGGQTGPAVTFGGAQTAACVLSGFTIENGGVPSGDPGIDGGGIDGNGALATIEYCVIHGNSAPFESGSGGLGGGLSDCDGLIFGNTIYDNEAGLDGGGLYDCDGEISSNVVRDNVAAVNGGGLAFCDGELQNNLVYRNIAEFGGGLYACGDGTQGEILNTTIYANEADPATGAGGGLAYCDADLIQNCIIYANTAFSNAQLHVSPTPAYSCVQDWVGPEIDIITDDPAFASAAGGDFHLLDGSPCIDAGGLVAAVTEDFEGDTRPFDGTAEARGDGSDYDIGADEFTANRFDLTIAMVGNGTTDPVPGTYSHNEGTSVPLSATADPGWMFSRWEDDLGETLSVHPDYTIVMDEDKSVTAIFEEIEYVLTMAVVGEGTTVPAAGLYGYGDGAVVIVSATPSDGWDFDRWEGDLTGSVNPTTVTMDADKSVTAVFLRATHYTLTMAVDGNGTVDPAPGAHEIADGALVTLTATPAEGWHFVHWQGGLQSVENPATVTMDEDRSVTAVFAESAPVSTADEKPPNTRSLECPTAATPSPPGGNPGPMALSLAVCWIAAKLLARRGRRRASDG